ncbi:hypothetical protein [Terriglobus aquaticus]|uniref:DUF4173 domain-containing protein n=1 Tax=Terriglobus aquaticus TaxID=940139 RepID=A0ABW9KHJ8_9BACT|nr:hypothetical protein [Terriglobus aquaticus]
MFSVQWNSPLGSLDLLLGVITFALLIRSRSLKSYWPLLYIVLWQILPFLTFQWLHDSKPFPAVICYDIYFYCYWSSFACAAACSVLLTYTIFQEALKPLKGLQSLGQVMYRWVLGISFLVIVSSALGSTASSDLPMIRVVSELMRLSGLLVMCLLIFVGFTIRPLGLSLRSRTFGVSVGMAAAMVAYMLLTGPLFVKRYLYASGNTLMTAAGLISQLIWIWYFAVPEPQRKFLLLPTTSPFHQWNLVSERMGYDPGYVAIGGIAPDALSGSEREVFERIAAQDTGRLPRLQEVGGESPIPAGWSSATAEATERFSRAWDFRYVEEEAIKKEKRDQAHS